MNGDSNIAKEFQKRVRATLESENDQKTLYTSLKKYQEDRDIAALVNTMKGLLSSPDRLVLFDDMRPFVAVNQQVEYNNLCPILTSKKTRLVYLTRRGLEPLGFKFRGGLEHGIGLYISEVTPGSQAEQKGLWQGDEILQVNGFNVSQVTHGEALGAMKLKKMLTLKVSSTGLVPIKESCDDPVSWQFVKSRSPLDQSLPTNLSAADANRNIVAQERKVFATLAEGQRLGCGISSGQSNRPGIFIHKVTPHTLAEQLGLQVGDQILSVNDVSFLDISHAEALVALKSSRHLTIVLKSWVEDNVTLETAAPTVAHVKAPDSDAIYATVTRTTPHNTKPEPSQKPTSQNQAFIEVHATEGGLEAKTVEAKTAPQTTDQPSWWTKDPFTMFTSRQIDNRELRRLEMYKDGPLLMYLEGGIASPLGGKVIVAGVDKGGVAERNGISKGDQIMMVEGKKMIDVTLEEVQKAFKDLMQGPLDGSQMLRVMIAVAPPKDYEDEVTFF